LQHSGLMMNWNSENVMSAAENSTFSHWWVMFNYQNNIAKVCVPLIIIWTFMQHIELT